MIFFFHRGEEQLRRLLSLVPFQTASCDNVQNSQKFEYRSEKKLKMNNSRFITLTS